MITTLLATTLAIGPWFDDFRTYEEVDAYLDELAAASDAATVLEVGTSIEGRAIRGLRISHAQTRPALVVIGDAACPGVGLADGDGVHRRPPRARR